METIRQDDVGLRGLLRRDIVLGRGGLANHHVGNQEYREIVSLYKASYLGAKRQKDKHVIVKGVLSHLQRECFRFVKKVDGRWVEAPPKKSRAKVIQALREGAPELRNRMIANERIFEASGPVIDTAPEGHSRSAEPKVDDDWVEVSIPLNEKPEATDANADLDSSEHDMEPMEVSFSFDSSTFESDWLAGGLDFDLEDSSVDFLFDLLNLDH